MMKENEYRPLITWTEEDVYNISYQLGREVKEEEKEDIFQCCVDKLDRNEYLADIISSLLTEAIEEYYREADENEDE